MERALAGSRLPADSNPPRRKTGLVLAAEFHAARLLRQAWDRWKEVRLWHVVADRWGCVSACLRADTWAWLQPGGGHLPLSLGHRLGRTH